MLVMWLIACGFVLFRPLVSVELFVLAGLVGSAVGGGLPIVDPWVGPAISIVLAVLSFTGWGEQRRERRHEAIGRTHAEERQVSPPPRRPRCLRCIKREQALDQRTVVR